MSTGPAPRDPPVAPPGDGLPPTPDFATWPVRHRPLGVAVDEGTLRLDWSDGRRSRFHFRWLREGCACAACVHPSTREQLLDLTTVARDVAPQRVWLEEGGALAIRWRGDGHLSRFHPGWLRALDYSNPADSAPRAAAAATWDCGFAARIPSFDGCAVLGDDDALHAWLRALREYGLTRLRDLPRDPGAVERVARRVGVIRDSNFGHLFDVRSEVTPQSNAYTAARLPLHTDLPTREVQPGVQMLHCLVNTARGGESVMVDGYRLAEVLREEEPEAFRLLSSTPIDFVSRSADFEYRHRTPMIVLDEHGRVRELRAGAFVRAPLQAPFELMEALFDAIQSFFRLTEDPRLRAVFPIAAGDLLAFDNGRVLHARTAFDAGSGERHLRGCYLDREEVDSRLRVLERTRRPG